MPVRINTGPDIYTTTLQYGDVKVSLYALKALFDHVDQPILCIKIVRAFTGLSLRDSKDMVDMYTAIRQLAKEV
jgi:ribosomal protein L7/L12